MKNKSKTELQPEKISEFCEKNETRNLSKMEYAVIDESDDEGGPIFEKKKLNTSGIADEQKIITNTDVELLKSEETAWEFPWEDILRGEFSEFDKYKKVRALGRGYVKKVHYSRLILYHIGYVWLTTIILLVSLFIANIRYACCDNRVDVGFDVVIFVIILFFLFDFILNTIGGVNYNISFDFWADIVSLLVLIFDVSLLKNAIYASDKTTLKIGTWAFYYVVEILRLIRLTKLIRLYFMKKYFRHFEYFVEFYEVDELTAKRLTQTADPTEEENDELLDDIIARRLKSGHGSRQGSSTTGVRKKATSEIKIIGEIVGGFSAKSKTKPLIKRKRKFKTSRISQRIMYLTTKRVMFTMTILFIFLPIISFYFYTQGSFMLAGDILLLQSLDIPTAHAYASVAMQKNYKSQNIPITYFSITGSSNPTIYNSTTLRPSEIITVNSQANHYSINISVKSFTQLHYILDILRVLFVALLYFQRLYTFEKDAKEKIMTPIDRLLDKVKIMAKNPSNALHLAGEYREMKNTDLIVIEDVIQKIAYLLVLGFGEAGNSILSKVLSISRDIRVDYLGKPNTVFAIFGFCDIRNFTDVTEILVDDVLNFVNSIAKIVHTEVNENQGGANKNIGDAFLVVWRLKGKEVSDIDKFTKPSQTAQEIMKLRRTLSEFERRGFEPLSFGNDGRNTAFDDTSFANQNKIQERYLNNLNNSSISELSLISFLRIMAQLIVNPVIRKYNTNKRINKGLPEYKVNLGFGLHAGSAIEGAIGSTFKIDMSYLSANVNMAPRLEGLTKIYKVPLLFTSSLYNMFTTTNLQKICRKVDRVYLTGTSDYYELYTVDVYTQDLEDEIKNKRIPIVDKYNIVLPNNEDEDFKEQDIELSPEPAKLISDKNIRIDNISQSYLDSENKLEKSLLKSVIKKNVEEDAYIPYTEIQRMWEFLISDKPTTILIGEAASTDIKESRAELSVLYNQAVEEYLEHRWENAKMLFEKLLAMAPQKTIYSAVYEFMKGSNFHIPEDFKQGRQTD